MYNVHNYVRKLVIINHFIKTYRTLISFENHILVLITINIIFTLKKEAIGFIFDIKI